MKFCDIPVGKAFQYQGEAYIKLTPLVARHEASGEQRFFRRASVIQPQTEAFVPNTAETQKQFRYDVIHQAIDEFCEGSLRNIGALETIRLVDVQDALERGRNDFLSKFK